MAVGTYALTSLDNLKAWIGVSVATYDAVLEQSIDRSTSIVESYCDRRFMSRTFREWVEPKGSDTLTVSHRPIVSVNTVSFGSAQAMSISSDTSTTDVLATMGVDEDGLRLHKVASDGTTTTASLAFSTYATTSALVTQINSSVSGWTASLIANAYARTLYRFAGRGVLNASGIIDYADDNGSDYRVDYDAGETHLSHDVPFNSFKPSRFPRGFHPVFVEYEAGYATAPADLEQATIEIAADLYRDRLSDRTLASESLGDYNYSQTSVADLLADRVGKLDAYREIR